MSCYAIACDAAVDFPIGQTFFIRWWIGQRAAGHVTKVRAYRHVRLGHSDDGS
jgi:hypothetical protein